MTQPDPRERLAILRRVAEQEPLDVSDIDALRACGAELATARLALTQIRDLCDQIHGHGADSQHEEINRLRGIISTIWGHTDPTEGAR